MSRLRLVVAIALVSSFLAACASSATAPSGPSNGPVAHDCSGYTTPGGECV